MKYTAQFADIKQRTYTIEITTETGSGTQSFKLGATPFKTSMKADGKHIYAPMKTTGATISMLTNTYNFDLYTGKSQGTKVTLKDSNNNIVWVGYLTPCIYDMGFDEYFEEIELEAVDGLAVLKDIPFTTNSKDIDTFANIIFKCLKQSGCYKYLYITDNVQLTAGGNISIIDKFRISQQNFFEQKKDVEQTDADVANSCYDVLKEIMQYLGYTMFADGESVFAVDYDAIKSGNNKYFRYSLTGSTMPSPTSTTMQYSKYIDGVDYSASGTNISLDNVYNKISVKNEFYTYDNLFPDFGDVKKETNITASADTIPSTNGHYLENDVFVRTDANGNPNNFQIFISKSWKNRMWLIVNKFYESPVFDFLTYDTTTSHAPVTISQPRWSNMLRNNGAFYVRQWKREIKGSDYNSWRVNYPANWGSQTEAQRYAAWLELLKAEPEKISLSPMITMVKQTTNRIGPSSYNHRGNYDRYTSTGAKEDCQYYPVVKLKPNQDSSAIFGGEGSYIIIKGSFRYHDEVETPYPLADGGDNDDLNRAVDYKYGEEGFLWARLKWGASYWNGDGWGTTATDFKLRFWATDRPNKPDCQNKTIFDNDFDFLDTAMSQYGCDEKGVYIPAPTEGNLSGAAEFTLYLQRDMWGDSRRSHWHDANRYNRYYSDVVILKNLQIKAYISNGLTNDDKKDTDTVYTNIIDNGSVNKMEQIKFKVCTFDNKKPTYSSVDYLDNGKSVFVTKTVNKANASRESGSISSFDNKAGLTQEEHLIFKLVNQYENPKVQFTANLHNDGHKLYGTYTDKTISGKTFIPDEFEIDYKANKAKIKLTEKW